MITSEKLRQSIVILLSITACSAALILFALPFQFYVWEFFLDGRLLVMTAVSYLAWKRGWLSIAAPEFRLLRFQPGRSILLFLLPLILYSIPIAAGLFLKEVKIETMDNAATLVLATLFDIPAIYVFSATTIMAEEILFRGFLLRSFRSHVGAFKGTLIVTAVWTLYCVPEILGIPDLPIAGALALLLYYSATGLFCSSLMIATDSLWAGYSFRTGIIALTPIVLTSVVTESDSFLSTSSILFGAEGIIVSVLVLSAAIIIYRRASRPAISA